MSAIPIRIDPPPMLQGNTAQQLASLRNYLWNVSQQLSRSLTAVNEGNMVITPKSSVEVVATSPEASQHLAQQAANLKALIIKTADEIRLAEDRITEKMRSDYVAISEFGEYKETADATYNLTAKGLNWDVLFNEDIAAAGGYVALGGLSEYHRELIGNIRIGLIEVDGEYTVGIAMGQNISVTATTQEHDGKQYHVIQAPKEGSVYTPGKLAFYINGVEVAYFSNDQLFVRVITVDTLYVNRAAYFGNWYATFDGPFTLQKIGG